MEPEPKGTSERERAMSLEWNVTLPTFVWRDTRDSLGNAMACFGWFADRALRASSGEFNGRAIQKTGARGVESMTAEINEAENSRLLNQDDVVSDLGGRGATQCG